MRRAFFCLAYVFALLPSLQAANPVPFVSQPLAPASVVPGGPAFTMTVHGTGFVTNSVVRWNGSSRATTFVSQAELQAQILATDIASAGTGTVTVSSGGPASNSAFLFVVSPVSKPTFKRDLVLLANAPSNLVADDFNNDGKTDMAVASGFAQLYRSNPEVGILLGNGDGSFEPVFGYKTAPETFNVAMGDFNGDGITDLVVSGLSGFKVEDDFAFSILIGNGDGTFQPAKNYAGPFCCLSTLLVADFNRDGKLDIAVIDHDAGVLAVLPGNGDGTFQAPVMTACDFCYWDAVADFNGDGILDLAGPGEVALGNGDGTFQSPTLITTNNIPDAAAVADFNGDGKLDIVSTGSDGASLCLGNGDGTFQPCKIFADDPSGSGTAIAIDVNGDGKLDLVTNHRSKMSYLLGNGDGTFQNYVAFFFPSPGPFVAGDFNGDGKPDFGLVGEQGLNSSLGFYQLLQKP
jgi:hypothetical protein